MRDKRWIVKIHISSMNKLHIEFVDSIRFEFGGAKKSSFDTAVEVPEDAPPPLYNEIIIMKACTCFTEGKIKKIKK